MKKFTCLILFSILCLLFSSCKKWGSGYVEGAVYHLTTKQPIQGAKVTLRRNHNGNTDFTVKETTTDADGHFKIKYFHKAPFTSYRYNVCSYLRSGGGVAGEQKLDNRKTTGVVLYTW